MMCATKYNAECVFQCVCMGVLAVGLHCDRLDRPCSCSESLFPKPVTVAARELGDLAETQPHKSVLKGELPHEQSLCLFVCLLLYLTNQI